MRISKVIYNNMHNSNVKSSYYFGAAQKCLKGFWNCTYSTRVIVGEYLLKI